MAMHEHWASVAGVELASGSTGLRASDDLVLMRLCQGSGAAAVFTRNSFRAPPVQIAEQHLQATMPRALIVNAGNANAGTGEPGSQDGRALCQAAAELLGIEAREVLPFSTGVIGERLPVQALRDALQHLPAALSEDGWGAAARAMMTTDTRPKGASCDFTLQGQRRTLTGIAKGAGMICPNMATMLAFMATDAAVTKADLQAILREVVATTFNRITVDGDTSTNDACVLISTNTAAAGPLSDSDRRLLFDALHELALELAQSIIRDAEGATRFITIEVAEGRTTAECLQVAYSLAHSPLVKTAIFAGEPNWGRLLMAIGKAGIDDLEPSKVDVFFDDLCLFSQGQVTPSYTAEQGAQIMRQDAFSIRVSLHRGAKSARLWTSDLSEDYVRINASYIT